MFASRKLFASLTGGRFRVSRWFSTQQTRMSDPYKVLEASRNEDFSSIKKKYYKMVNLYHPDKNGTEVDCVK